MQVVVFSLERATVPTVESLTGSRNLPSPRLRGSAETQPIR
jgi:hypothetical protein